MAVLLQRLMALTAKIDLEFFENAAMSGELRHKFTRRAFDERV